MTLPKEKDKPMTPFDLLSMGFWLFPVRNKVPLVRWSRESSNDPNVIARWIAEFPGCDFGINHGLSGTCCLDDDSGKNPEGETTMAILDLDYGPMPSTFMVGTINHGVHYIYRGELANTQGSQTGRPGVDTKGPGGYTVAPCSQGYSVISNAPIAPVPEWLVSLVGKPSPHAARSLAPIIALDENSAIALAIRFLTSAEPAIQGQAGDKRTFLTACRVKDFGVSQEQNLELMLEFYNPDCLPPWSDAGMAEKVRSAYASGKYPPGIANPEAFFTIFEDPDPPVRPSPSDVWPDPIPFSDYSNLPLFPVEAIPGVCGEMVKALTDSCQVDPGLPGSMMLATLSTAIGAKLKVILDTHTEQGNLYMISVLGSGNRKSEVAKHLASPIYEYQRRAQEGMNGPIREAENRRRILEKRLEKLQREAAKESDPIAQRGFIADSADVSRELEENPVPRRPVYLVDDITPEALGQLMADNGETAAILSAEGGIFRIIAGLYHNGQANYDLFLKAHSGDFWSNHRIGREAKTMESPTLTLGLAVQPDVIEEIGRNSEFRGRGLSARFLYSWCSSKAGYRTRQSAPIPVNVKYSYHNVIQYLMAVDGRHELALSPDAQDIWNIFYNDVEILLRPGGELEHLVDWGSKLPGAVARISGLLHFADSAGGFLSNPISKKTVLSACIIGSYYLEHAKAVFGLMKEDARITTAKKILVYIKRYKPTILKGRDLFNHTNCQSMQEIQPGLNILVERGYIREFSQHMIEKHKGRPEATIYEVNPKCFSDL